MGGTQDANRFRSSPPHPRPQISPEGCLLYRMDEDSGRRAFMHLDEVHLRRNIRCRPNAHGAGTPCRFTRPTSQFGGVGLQSLIQAPDEELLGSLASITFDLMSFFRSKDSPVYTKLADALDSMADTRDTTHGETLIPTIKLILSVSTRAHAFLDTIPQTEIDFTTSLAMCERKVEISGRYYPLEQPSILEPIVLPDLRSTADYEKTPCKHECAILKQSKHARQAHEVCMNGSTVQTALLLSRAGQCGMDTTMIGLQEVQAVATMDRPANYEHVDLGEASLYNAATLNLHGLPYDFPILRPSTAVPDLQ